MLSYRAGVFMSHMCVCLCVWSVKLTHDAWHVVCTTATGNSQRNTYLSCELILITEAYLTQMKSVMTHLTYARISVSCSHTE